MSVGSISSNQARFDSGMKDLKGARETIKKVTFNLAKKLDAALLKGLKMVCKGCLQIGKSLLTKGFPNLAKIIGKGGLGTLKIGAAGVGMGAAAIKSRFDKNENKNSQTQKTGAEGENGVTETSTQANRINQQPAEVTVATGTTAPTTRKTN